MAELPKVLIVGVGSIGERHARCFQATARATVAICEPDDSLRQQIAERYGIATAYANLEHLVDDQIDLAVIATPAPLHIPQARMLVERGSHVLIEKPLSTSDAGVEDLNQRAAQKNVVCGVAYPYRAHPAFAAMRAAIVADKFGRPLQITVTAGQHFPTYRPAYRDTYYRLRETGGGAIQDALSHMINAVDWLVGPTSRVIGDAERLKLDGVSAEDTTHVLARNGDVMVSYTLNQHQPANELTITVNCERGQARFEGHRCKWKWLREVDGDWQDEPFHIPDRDEIFRRQANSFLDAVEQRTEPLCSLEEGRWTLDCVLAILRSLSSLHWEPVE